MPEVWNASARALRDLFSRGILWHALWPPVVAFVAWVGVAWLVWTPLGQWLLGYVPEDSWLNSLGTYLVHVVLVLAFAPLIYLTAVLLVAVVALPRMMTIVAQRDYPDVRRYGTAAGAFWGSLANTLTAGAIFIVGWLLSLPLLLVPGALLVLPLVWSAWLNQRTFRFDVLAEHATPDERTQLIERAGGRFRLAGLVAALAAHVPVANLLAPAFGALLFSHLGLELLRQRRRQEPIVVSTPAGNG